MVDEAYIHFADTDTAIDLVKADKDVVVLRTFSKSTAWQDFAAASRLRAQTCSRSSTISAEISCRPRESPPPSPA